MVPKVSENLKMVVVFGEPTGIGENKESEDWDTCLYSCWKTSDCLVVKQLPNGCVSYTVLNIQSITKTSSKQRVAIKMSFPGKTCPLPSLNPPLFGNTSSSIIVASSVDNNYYKSELTEEDSQWVFRYSIHKCTTDIPESYDSLDLTDPYRYVYNLTASFFPGETFFMRGKISNNIQAMFSISFLQSTKNNWPIHIKIFNNVFDSIHKVEIATWVGNDRMQVLDDITNPYDHGDDFEIRINSTELQAFIQMNSYPIITYELVESVPLQDIDQFIINFDKGYVYLDYVGWTGNCWFDSILE